MAKKMRHFAFALVVSTLLGCSDSDQYCRGLIETARSADTQAYLRDWVSQNIYERRYSGDKSDIQGAGGMWPGFFWVDLEFDWSRLNLKNENGFGQIRLVEYPDHVSSVFFGERSGFGFLVRTPGSGNFGIDDGYVEWHDDDMVVICRERD